MTLPTLLSQIKQCRECEPKLSHGANPVVQAHESARLLIIGQAPGLRVHKSGIPWDDPSGDRLRNWLGIRRELFYSNRVAIVPMGFCYPGKANSGDLPPRKECAPKWHHPLLQTLTGVELTVLIGAHAQQYYLSNNAKFSDKPKTLTETVMNYRQFLPHYFVLPHPSPRNNIWLKKNPWFETDVLPELAQQIKRVNLI